MSGMYMFVAQGWSQKRGLFVQTCLGFFCVFLIQAQPAVTDSLGDRLEQIHNPARRLSVCLTFTQHAYEATRFEESLNYAQQAQVLARSLNDSVRWAESLYWQSRNHLQMSDFSEALAAELQSLEYYLPQADSLKLAYGYQQLATIYSRLQETEKAILFYHRALAVFEKFHLPAEYMQCHADLGLAYTQAGKFAQAWLCTKEILPYYIQKKDSGAVAATFQHMGEICRQQGALKQAQIYFMQGVKWLPPTDYSRAYYLYESIAQTLSQQEKYAQAKKYALLALEKIEKVAHISADKIRLKYVYHLLFQLSKKEGKYEESLHYLEKEIAFTEKLASFEDGKQVARIQAVQEIEKKALLIDSLHKDTNIQQKDLEHKTLLIALLVMGVFFSMLAAGGYSRSAYMRKKNSHLLNWKNQEIQKQKESLEKYASEIHTINEELKTMNELLDENVKESTQALFDQNKCLIEYQYLNAHKVRGPLARILGLVNLIKVCELAPYPLELLVLLERSALELDEIVHEIKNVLDTGENKPEPSFQEHT